MKIPTFTFSSPFLKIYDITVSSISFLATPAPCCPLGQNVPQPSYHHDAQPVLQPQVRERHRKGANSDQEVGLAHGGAQHHHQPRVQTC